jgi:hypothetical protein
LKDTRPFLGHQGPLFAEVESGKVADRPGPAKALHLAEFIGATLLIARLDWLSTNTACLT